MNKKRNTKSGFFHIIKNSIYIAQTTWDKDKVVLFTVVGLALLIVASNAAALFLPRTVLIQITSGVSAWKLAATVLIFTLIIVGIESAKKSFEKQIPLIIVI